MYYADYFVDGAVKSVQDRRLQGNGANFEWQCCTGTFPQDVAEYANMLYYTDEEGIYVSQYMKSRAEFTIRGEKAVLENCSEEDVSPIRRFLDTGLGESFLSAFLSGSPLGKGRKPHSRERRRIRAWSRYRTAGLFWSGYGRRMM